MASRVSRIVLALHACALRDERRSDHLACIAPLDERPVRDVARAAGLVSDALLAIARNAVEPGLQLGQEIREAGPRASAPSYRPGALQW